MNAHLRIGYARTVDALWLMLLVAIPVTSFPPLVTLAGGISRGAAGCPHSPGWPDGRLARARLASRA